MHRVINPNSYVVQARVRAVEVSHRGSTANGILLRSLKDHLSGFAGG
jgi:hypothetical protein